MRMRVFLIKLRVEIESEMRVFLETLNFEIEMRLSQKSVVRISITRRYQRKMSSASFRVRADRVE